MTCVNLLDGGLSLILVVTYLIVVVVVILVLVLLVAVLVFLVFIVLPDVWEELCERYPRLRDRFRR